MDSAPNPLNVWNPNNQEARMKRERIAKVAAAMLAGVTFVAGSAFVDANDPRTVPLMPSVAVATPPAVAHAAAALTAPAAPDASSSAEVTADVDETLTLVKIDENERQRLAAEMSKWITRHPRELVEVIANLAETRPLPLPPTYLLSIAWSETRGKVLAVSPAGAAGLAQATPAAYLSEGLGGKLFVNNDYLMGTRAYIMKKPLGDALTISGRLLKKNTPTERRRVAKLVAHAIDLRREGMEELEALRPVANATFFKRIADGEAYNLKTLRELEQLVDRGAPRAELKRFNSRVQRDYTYLRNLQRTGWARYEKALTARRDALLRKEYGQSAAAVITSRPYEAGEFLGEALDARFSPTHMAEFLAAHLETKQQQARELGIAEDGLDAWTAALYNGGAVNIKRMRAGLIGTLTETQKYMKAVPARMARLERASG